MDFPHTDSLILEDRQWKNTLLNTFCETRERVEYVFRTRNVNEEWGMTAFLYLASAAALYRAGECGPWIEVTAHSGKSQAWLYRTATHFAGSFHESFDLVNIVKRGDFGVSISKKEFIGLTNMVIMRDLLDCFMAFMRQEFITFHSDDDDLELSLHLAELNLEWIDSKWGNIPVALAYASQALCQVRQDTWASTVPAVDGFEDYQRADWYKACCELHTAACGIPFFGVQPCVSSIEQGEYQALREFFIGDTPVNI